MKVFDVDRAAVRRAYDEHGWVHARSGVDPEFLAVLQRSVDERLGAGWLDGPGLAGAKQQVLFDLPTTIDLEADLLDPVAEMFGLGRHRLTLSERHLKVYDDNAAPDPVPHKDRLASTVSLGITVRAPAGTRAFLHPDREVGINPFMAPHLLASLPPERHPSSALPPNSAVQIADAPGDVLAFAGSAFWHGRRRAAGAVLLYLKFNDFGSDPLREDPRTEALLERSSALTTEGSSNRRVWLGPDFVALAERAIPPRWEHATVAEVWDRAPLWLSAIERELIEAAVGGPTLAALTDQLADAGTVLAAVRRLSAAGVVLVTE